MATVSEVAHWMLRQFEEQGQLQHRQLVADIRDNFGDDFIYRARYGEGALKPAVLEAFRALTPNGVVWSIREQAWRRPSPDDPPGQRLAEQRLRSSRARVARSA
jgi:hypothetical protein